MAEIIPFRAWRYHPKLYSQMEELTSPLFDVVNAQHRAALYKNPINSIHLSVPDSKQPAISAYNTLNKWKSEGILVQDDTPSIYAYYQYFTLPGYQKQLIRKGFVALLQLHNWDSTKNKILRHEATMPHSVSDRSNILEETQLQTSPTHGLFTDAKLHIESLLDEAIKEPVYETEDYQGVKDVLARIDDPETIETIVDLMKEKEIILADGHHRYEGALDYRNRMRISNPSHTGKESYNQHMMYFTNTESEDIRILPTHRLITDIHVNESELMQRLQKDFIIKPVENVADINEVILGKRWAFGLLIDDSAYKIRLKPEAYEKFESDLPELIKSLDNTVLHQIVIDKYLGIPVDKQPNSPHLRYERNFTKCLQSVIKKESTLALITQEISINIVKEVCYSGHTLPQKSTYFYPKVIAGFLFGSIDPNDQ